MSLHSNFYNISWVCKRNGNTTCYHTSCNFLQKCWSLTWSHWTTQGIPYRNVKANSESRVNQLSLKTWSKSTENRLRSFFLCNYTQCSKKPIVLWFLTSSNLLDLHPNFSSINRDCKHLSNHSCCRCHKYISAKESNRSFSFAFLGMHN